MCNEIIILYTNTCKKLRRSYKTNWFARSLNGWTNKSHKDLDLDGFKTPLVFFFLKHIKKQLVP